MRQTLVLVSLILAAPLVRAEDMPEGTSRTSSATERRHSSPAVSSEFFFYPERGESVARVGWKTSSANYRYALVSEGSDEEFVMLNAEETSKELAMELKFGLARGWFLSLGTGYRDTRWKYEGAHEAQAKGLTDLEVGMNRMIRSGERRLFYGLSASASPAPAKSASKAQVGNSFSGGEKLSPMIGVESKLARGVAGGRFAAEFHLGANEVENALGEIEYVEQNDYVIGDVFYEFPVVERAALGMSLGLAQPLRAVVNQNGYYGAKIYGNMPVWKETAIQAVLGTTSELEGPTTTQMGLELRTAL